jgi:predicted  nucleic acid-binding Zn-ribbon protein
MFSVINEKNGSAGSNVADFAFYTQDKGGIDDYDVYFDKIQKINNEMDTNKNAFDAWQETIKTAISSEVSAGINLEADVSNRVKQWQTQLMGISDFTGESETAGVDDFVNKLQLASEVTFGGMRAEVDDFVRQQEDRDNGLNDSTSGVIEALTTQYDNLNLLNPQLETANKDLTDFNDALGILNDKIGTNEDGIILAYTLMDTAISNSATALEDFTNRVNNLKLSETIGQNGNYMKFDDAGWQSDPQSSLSNDYMSFGGAEWQVNGVGKP